MGADGYIQVFDWKKVKDKFPDADEKIVSSMGYIQKMVTPDGKEFEVFSGYYGDNLICFWDDIQDNIGYGKSKEYQDRCRKIIVWMKQNAQLFTWEIWT